MNRAKTLKTLTALSAAAIITVAGALGYVVTTSQRNQQPRPTLEAVATVTPTPTIDGSYYMLPTEMMPPEATPTAILIPTSTLPPYAPLPFWTPPFYVPSMPELDELAETPVPTPTVTAMPTPTPAPNLEERTIKEAKLNCSETIVFKNIMLKLSAYSSFHILC